MKVRQIIKLLTDDGWFQVARKGSHRQFKHDTKPGRVTVAGKPNDDTWHLAQRTTSCGRLDLRTKRTSTMHRYLVIIEKANGNYSAFSPDVPGCIATGATREEAEQEFHSALQMHLEGLKEDGLPIPLPSASVRYVEV